MHGRAMTVAPEGAASERIDDVTGLTDCNREQGMTLTLESTGNNALIGAHLP